MTQQCTAGQHTGPETFSTRQTYVAADKRSALQHSSNSVFSKHTQPGNLPAYGIRKCNPTRNLLGASNGVAIRGQTPIALATKWQSPVFSSNSVGTGSKLKIKCQAKALPAVDAANGDFSDPVNCQQDPAPAAAIASSCAVKKNGTTHSPLTSVNKNALAAADTASLPHLQAANVRIPPASISSVQQDRARLHCSGTSQTPNTMHATVAPGQIKLPTIASPAVPLAINISAKAVHPAAKPAKANDLSAKAAQPTGKPAAARGAAQQSAEVSPVQKKNSAPKKRKLLAPSLGIAALFETSAEQHKPEQDFSNATANVNAEDQGQPIAGNTCKLSLYYNTTH